jgi:hypothetical protein
MNVNQAQRSKPARVGLRQQVLLAALDCSGGELGRPFTAEDLLLAAWRRDPAAWGLRGHEREFPDSERMYKELESRGLKNNNVPTGPVGLGLLEKVRQRTYRLTPAGLAAASRVAGAASNMPAKAERQLSDAVALILSHPVFRDWMTNPAAPKHFRDAGHFWGIAPGTPPRVIRTRINDVDNTLATSLSLLEKQGAEEMAARHGKVLFDRKDIERAMEFHAALKHRFSRDLQMLQVNIG